MSIALRYDDLFLNNVAGGSHRAAKEKASKVVQLAQVYFSSKSLGTTVELHIVSIKHRDTELRLRHDGACNQDCMIDKAERLTARDSDEADNYHYLTQDVLLEDDSRGISYVGSVCHFYKSFRTSISEAVKIEEGIGWTQTAKV